MGKTRGRRYRRSKQNMVVPQPEVSLGHVESSVLCKTDDITPSMSKMLCTRARWREGHCTILQKSAAELRGGFSGKTRPLMISRRVIGGLSDEEWNDMRNEVPPSMTKEDPVMVCSSLSSWVRGAINKIVRPSLRLSLELMAGECPVSGSSSTIEMVEGLNTSSTTESSCGASLRGSRTSSRSKTTCLEEFEHPNMQQSSNKMQIEDIEEGQDPVIGGLSDEEWNDMRNEVPQIMTKEDPVMVCSYLSSWVRGAINKIVRPSLRLSLELMAGECPVSGSSSTIEMVEGLNTSSTTESSCGASLRGSRTSSRSKTTCLEEFEHPNMQQSSNKMQIEDIEEGQDPVIRTKQSRRGSSPRGNGTSPSNSSLVPCTSLSSQSATLLVDVEELGELMLVFEVPDSSLFENVLTEVQGTVTSFITTAESSEDEHLKAVLHNSSVVFTTDIFESAVKYIHTGLSSILQATGNLTITLADFNRSIENATEMLHSVAQRLHRASIDFPSEFDFQVILVSKLPPVTAEVIGAVIDSMVNECAKNGKLLAADEQLCKFLLAVSDRVGGMSLRPTPEDIPKLSLSTDNINPTGEHDSNTSHIGVCEVPSSSSNNSDLSEAPVATHPARCILSCQLNYLVSDTVDGVIQGAYDDLIDSSSSSSCQSPDLEEFYDRLMRPFSVVQIMEHPPSPLCGLEKNSPTSIEEPSTLIDLEQKRQVDVSLDAHLVSKEEKFTASLRMEGTDQEDVWNPSDILDQSTTRQHPEIGSSVIYRSLLLGSSLRRGSLSGNIEESISFSQGVIDVNDQSENYAEAQTQRTLETSYQEFHEKARKVVGQIVLLTSDEISALLQCEISSIDTGLPQALTNLVDTTLEEVQGVIDEDKDFMNAIMDPALFLEKVNLFAQRISQKVQCKLGELFHSFVIHSHQVKDKYKTGADKENQHDVTTSAKKILLLLLTRFKERLIACEAKSNEAKSMEHIAGEYLDSLVQSLQILDSEDPSLSTVSDLFTKTYDHQASLSPVLELPTKEASNCNGTQSEKKHRTLTPQRGLQLNASPETSQPTVSSSNTSQTIPNWEMYAESSVETLDLPPPEKKSKTALLTTAMVTADVMESLPRTQNPKSSFDSSNGLSSNTLRGDLVKCEESDAECHTMQEEQKVVPPPISETDGVGKKTKTTWFERFSSFTWGSLKKLKTAKNKRSPVVDIIQ